MTATERLWAWLRMYDEGFERSRFPFGVYRNPGEMRKDIIEVLDANDSLRRSIEGESSAYQAGYEAALADYEIEPST